MALVWAGVSGIGWGHLRGQRGEGGGGWDAFDFLKKNLKKERDDGWNDIKRNRCRWLRQPDWVLSSFLPSSETQITQLSASMSHFYSVLPVALWKPRLLLLLLPFICPLGSNVPQIPPSAFASYRMLSRDFISLWVRLMFEAQSQRGLLLVLILHLINLKTKLGKMISVIFKNKDCVNSKNTTTL